MAYQYKKDEELKKLYDAYTDYTTQKPVYEPQYQPQIDAMRDNIQNREKFSYDINSDALYQNLKDQYVQQGQMAMMDTMGRAAALTGGYGSSYGQQVGQQTYQGYLQGLNEQVPDLYSMALNRYIAEGDAMLRDYGLLLDQEAQDYGRHQDRYNMWQKEADRLYGEYRDALNTDYAMWRDSVADNKWQTEYDEALRQHNLALGLNADGTPSAGGSGGSGGSGGGSGGSGGGSGSWDTSAYGTNVVRLAQQLVGTDVDGDWGANSIAKAKAEGYTSFADVVAQLNYNQGNPYILDGQVHHTYAVPEPVVYDGGATSAEISRAAVEFVKSNPNAAVNSGKVNAFIRSKGYTEEEADAFRAYISELGARTTVGSAGH